MALRASVLRRAVCLAMPCSLQDIFIQHFAAYAACHRLHPREWRAASCISQCYTAALGSNLWSCPSGHFQQLVHHACHHRCCPRCCGPAAARWVDALQARMLPCPHHHAIFTLPHELLALWEFNRRAMTQLFFDCVRSTLITLLADPRRLGAMPGILMSLHTWGRNLSHHPHIHCLVSAGGLTPDNRWVASRDPLLLPVAPLRALLRGKFLGLLNQMLRTHRLTLPPQHDRLHWHRVVRTLYAKHWNLEILPAYDHAKGVALYLARYAKGGPIPKDRPLYCANNTVRMPYTDHRTHAQRWLTLHVNEFIARVLWHAPPDAQHTTRYAGLYCSARRHLHATACQALQHLARTAWPGPTHPCAPTPALQPSLPTPHLCPLCSKPLALRYLEPVHQRSEFYSHMPNAPPAHHGSARYNPSFNTTTQSKPPGAGNSQQYHGLSPAPGASLRVAC